jgi:hypothetical protein
VSALSARRVRRVRLAAPRDELVRRGVVVLEDALHTASVPGGDGGRMLLVRRLDVGRIVPARGPAALALAVERRLREVELHAVHAAADDAGDAPAVWFRDAAEAAALLAVRLAVGSPPEEWFWPAAVPAWTSAPGIEEGLRAVLRAAAAAPQGPAAVAEVARTLRARGGIDALLAAVTPADARALLAAAGWPFPSAPARPPAEATAGEDGDPPASAPPREAPPAEWRAVLARWVAEWGMDDVRAVWLAATVLVAERPARAADPHLPERALRLVREVVAERAESVPPRTPAPRGGDGAARHPHSHRHPPAAPVPPESRAVIAAADNAGDPHLTTRPAASTREDDRVIGSRRPSIPAPPAAREGAEPVDAVRSPSPSISPAVESAVRAADPVAERPIESPPQHPQHPQPSRAADVQETEMRGIREEGDAGEATAGGGLFFLVAALERLGMAEFLADHPALLDAGLPSRVLLRVARRVGMADGDPARRCLVDGVHAPEPGADLSFAAPDPWSRGIARAGETRVEGQTTFDASGRLPLAFRAGGGAVGVEVAVEAWVTALRRWCRRRARLGVADVALRPGRFAATRTHLDVTLPMSAVDVRVRAAGMDLDPGWVPWLGRVIAFHYE